MRACDACGKPNAGISLGGTLLCRPCSADVEDEIIKLRAKGEPVNAIHIARRLFRETHSAGNYLLRDIPEELWAQAKHRAVDDDMSLRDLIISALTLYLSKPRR